MRADAKILIVDDEHQIRRLLRSALSRSNYACVEAEDGRELVNALSIDKPDLVLLDLGLPDRDGLELIPLIKKAGSAKIIVVTAREQTQEKIAALDLGADDYVTKPFDTDELLARIRAALRQRLFSDEARSKLRCGNVEIELARRSVRRDGVEVHLSPKEFGVLIELAAAPGRVITHRRLLTSVWGPAQADRAEYLRVVMRSLRQKLEQEPARPKLLLNEPGVGYRLRASDADN
ncbi:MAG TPA: response regulator [Allosphingosinicella sp.]|jgi:two-component system KDP operon response regulator KdpE|uniref:response regulator n=1 Tax=Allosphingosinicella sp. TaxID=2823234 RepID=UPI002F2A6607